MLLLPYDFQRQNVAVVLDGFLLPVQIELAVGKIQASAGVEGAVEGFQGFQQLLILHQARTGLHPLPEPVHLLPGQIPLQLGDQTVFLPGAEEPADGDGVKDHPGFVEAEGGVIGFVAALVVRSGRRFHPHRKRTLLAEPFQHRKIPADPLFGAMFLRVLQEQTVMDLVQGQLLIGVGLLLQNGENVDQPGGAHGNLLQATIVFYSIPQKRRRGNTRSREKNKRRGSIVMERAVREILRLGGNPLVENLLQAAGKVPAGWGGKKK